MKGMQERKTGRKEKALQGHLNTAQTWGFSIAQQNYDNAASEGLSSLVFMSMSPNMKRVNSSWAIPRVWQWTVGRNAAVTLSRKAGDTEPRRDRWHRSDTSSKRHAEAGVIIARCLNTHTPIYILYIYVHKYTHTTDLTLSFNVKLLRHINIATSCAWEDWYKKAKLKCIQEAFKPGVEKV